jgi:hypothetical protein
MKHLNHLFLSIALTICFFDSYAQTYQGPESVDYYPANNCYYIGNTQASPKVIYKRSPNGTLSTFVNPGGSPYGIEIVDSILYVCVGGGVKAYNLNTSALVFNQSLGASFLNGITHDNNGNLYVTDFSANKVYRLNRFTQQFNVFVNNTSDTPNGIVYDEYDGINPRLVYVCWGSGAKVKAINLADSTQTTLVTTTLGNIDGIAKGNGGYFYLASWTPDVITRYDSTFTAGTGVTVVSGLNSPADIYYNLQTDTLAVPNSGNNTVTFHHFLITGEKEMEATNKLSFVAGPKSLLFSEPAVQSLQIEVFAIDGKLCFSGHLPAGSKEVALPNLEIGQYMVRMLDQQGHQHSGKFTITP